MQGYDVRPAFDGEEAFAIAEQFRLQVALLDTGMPKANGYTVARRIREHPWGTRMVLVAQTGWGRRTTSGGPRSPASTTTSSSRSPRPR